MDVRYFIRYHLNGRSTLHLCLELSISEQIIRNSFLFCGIFTMHFHTIKNNNIKQMQLNAFIIYIKYFYTFRPLLVILRD